MELNTTIFSIDSQVINQGEPQRQEDVNNIIHSFLGTLNISSEQKYSTLYSAMYKVCKDNNWGDPFSYARSREILMANVLGHKVSDTYSGADGYDELGEYEYKSTISKTINGAYNGISVQASEQEQIDYINNEKIRKYKTHYYARFAEDNIAELWSIPGDVVADILMPKVISQFHKKRNSKSKDPRIGVSVTAKEIKKYGSRIEI